MSVSAFSFQSTLPLRGATYAHGYICVQFVFQSTLPLRGATDVSFDLNVKDKFQSTLPLRGATRARPPAACRHKHFNPRSPCGERPVPYRVENHKFGISIHAPLAGSDTMTTAEDHVLLISIHAPLAGSDRPKSAETPPRSNFNPRSPCGERPQKWTDNLRD